MKKLTTKQLLLATLFATFSLILTRFFATYLMVLGSTSVRISLGNVPLFLAGFLLGPLAGGLAGAGADLMGMLFFPSPAGAYFPGFTLTACLSGVLPAILKKWIGGNMKWKNVFAILLITEVICSVFLNTLWVSILYGVPFNLVILPRTLVTIGMSVIYAGVITPLYRRLKDHL